MTNNPLPTFLETLRIENGFPLYLQWHQARMNRTRTTFFGNAETLSLEQILAQSWQKREATHQGNTPRPGKPCPDVVKCRIVYGLRIESISFELYHYKTIRSLGIVQADHLDYSFKFAERKCLNDLYRQRGKADEVLIVKEDYLTDVTYANIALSDGRRWLTPARPLLEGTCRARLLAEGILIEEQIRASELSLFKKIRLFNAMTGWERAYELPVTAIIISR